jgi:hypothetical protein
MLLLELLNSTIPDAQITYSKNGEDFVVDAALSDEENVQVYFEFIGGDGNQEAFEHEFLDSIPHGAFIDAPLPQLNRFYGGHTFHLFFKRNEETMTTGEGRELLIFSLVAQETKKFVAQHKPRMIYFSSDKVRVSFKGTRVSQRGRSALYKRLGKQLAGLYGYEFKAINGKYEDIFVVYQPFN